MSILANQRRIELRIEADDKEIAVRITGHARGVRPRANLAIFINGKEAGRFSTDMEGDADWNIPFPWPDFIPHLMTATWHQPRSLPYPRRGLLLTGKGEYPGGTETLEIRYVD